LCSRLCGYGIIFAAEKETGGQDEQKNGRFHLLPLVVAQHKHQDHMN
jgi:hypothetical protein